MKDGTVCAQRQEGRRRKSRWWVWTCGWHPEWEQSVLTQAAKQTSAQSAGSLRGKVRERVALNSHFTLWLYKHPDLSGHTLRVVWVRVAMFSGRRGGRGRKVWPPLFTEKKCNTDFQVFILKTNGKPHWKEWWEDLFSKTSILWVFFQVS